MIECKNCEAWKGGRHKDEEGESGTCHLKSKPSGSWPWTMSDEGCMEGVWNGDGICPECGFVGRLRKDSSYWPGVCAKCAIEKQAAAE